MGVWLCWTPARDWDKLGCVIVRFLTVEPPTEKFAIEPVPKVM